MYCPHCGAQVAVGTEQCVSCGKEIGIILPSAGVQSAPAAPVSTPEQQAYAVMHEAMTADIYAGFWKRVAACIIDGFITGIPGMIVVYVVILSLFGAGVSPELLAFFYFFLCLFVGLAQLLYFVILESSGKQATVGKMALGVVVTDMDGGRISILKALGRNLGKIVSGMIIYIGFIMAGFTEKKQGLHDMMAGCLVVNKRSVQNGQIRPV